jgi:hypothetical protein
MPLESRTDHLRAFWVTFIVAVAVAGSRESEAARRCEALFYPAIAGVTTPRVEVRPPRMEDYSQGGLHMRCVRDQGFFGSCWAHAPLGLFERRARNNGVEVDLSEDFLILHDLRRKAWESIGLFFGGHDLRRVQQGLRVDQANALIQDVGIVPREVFRSNINWGVSSNEAARMLNLINAILVRAKPEFHRLRTEFEALRARHRELVQRFYEETRVADDGNFVRPLSAQTHTVALIQQLRDRLRLQPEEAFPEEFSLTRDGSELSRRTMAEIDRLLAQAIGVPPDLFQWRGQTYTAKTFREAPLFKSRMGEHGLGQMGRLLQDPAATEARIRFAIDRGEELVTTLPWRAEFIEPASGLYSIERYGDPNLTPAQLREAYGFEAGWHALRVHDYALGADGRIAWLLLENSHGRQTTSTGYLHVSWATFLALDPHLFFTPAVEAAAGP